MGSWFSSNNINLQKDFDDALVGLKIDKDKLTKENFSDQIFLAIDNKYPKKKTKSQFDKIIAELEDFNKKIWKITEKYPGNNEKEKLKIFIFTVIAKIEKNIKYLNKSKEKVRNNTATNSMIAPEPSSPEPSAPKLEDINKNAGNAVVNPLAKPNANNSMIAPEPSAPKLEDINNNAAKPNANNAAAKKVANTAAKNKVTKNKPLSQNDEKLYSGIIPTLQILQKEMIKQTRESFNEKILENKQRKIKPPARKVQGINPGNFENLIKIFLIIQKLRGKLDNTSKNSKYFEENLIYLIKDFVVKTEQNINPTLTKLKNEIREQTDNESITYFNETSENLFEEYMLDYKPSIKFPVLEIPNNNNKIIEKPVQPVQPVQPVLVSGGSRKKSKKSRS